MGETAPAAGASGGNLMTTAMSFPIAAAARRFGPMEAVARQRDGPAQRRVRDFSVLSDRVCRRAVCGGSELESALNGDHRGRG
jgi:hypothetical protein